MENSFRYFTLFFVVLSFMLSGCKEDVPFNEKYDGTLFDFQKVYRFPAIDIPPDNPLTIAKVDLGRKLFYDQQVSKSKTMSCATCHNLEDSFTDNGLVLSTNDLGGLTKRNATPLFNLAWTDKGFFWDGRVMTLEEAVEDAVNNEQHPEWGGTLASLQDDETYNLEFSQSFTNAEVSEENVIKAIASFLRIIVSKDSKYDQSVRGQATLSALEQKGFDLIFTTEFGDCFHCHGVYPFMTDNDFHDNGLQDAPNLSDYADQGLGGFNGVTTDVGKMKAPPLRNLSYTAPYMHDGRFNTLDEVIDFYSDGLHVTPNIDPLMKQALQGGLQLSVQEKAALKAFLLTLDDPTFINNEDYKSPF
jgi:cytochrome c peroxidase